MTDRRPISPLSKKQYWPKQQSIPSPNSSHCLAFERLPNISVVLVLVLVFWFCFCQNYATMRH